MNSTKTEQRSDHRPETSVRTAERADTGCCGGPAPEGSQACCVRDATAKAAGEAGCGCATATNVKKSCC